MGFSEVFLGFLMEFFLVLTWVLLFSGTSLVVLGPTKKGLQRIFFFCLNFLSKSLLGFAS